MVGLWRGRVERGKRDRKGKGRAARPWWFGVKTYCLTGAERELEECVSEGEEMCPG